MVSLPYTGYTQLSPEEIKAKEAQGFTVLKMDGPSPLNSRGSLTETAAFITGLYRGLEKNKVELLPLATSIIDVNPGLRGQQHPKY